jgi:hypothetical protein
MALLGIALIAIPSGILAAAFTDQLRMEREAIGTKIATMMEDDNIDPDEKAHLEADARRLHITHAELDDMIAVAQKHRLDDQALRKEFNLSAANIDPQLAFEQFRGILMQMKVVIGASDEGLRSIIGRGDSATQLEKLIYDHVSNEKPASRGA